MNFQTRLKELRKEHGYSQRALAELINTDHSLIHKYEKGSEPSASNLISLANVFGVSIDYLVGLSDDPTPEIGESNLNPDEREVISLWRQGQRNKAATIILTSE